MIDVAFIYFRTTTLQHLDQAWYSLSKQDFTGVRSIHFIDNNTPDDPHEVEAALKRYPMPVPVLTSYIKHGDPAKTHSWSINEACRRVGEPWMLFTRSDYILDFDCVRRFKREVDSRGAGWRGFVTSYCYQMGCDAQLSNSDVTFFIIGYSGGGPYALACAYALPDRICGTAVLSGVGPVDAEEDLKFMTFLLSWPFPWDDTYLGLSGDCWSGMYFAWHTTIQLTCLSAGPGNDQPLTPGCSN